MEDVVVAVVVESILGRRDVEQGRQLNSRILRADPYAKLSHA